MSPAEHRDYARRLRQSARTYRNGAKEKGDLSRMQAFIAVFGAFFPDPIGSKAIAAGAGSMSIYNAQIASNYAEKANTLEKKADDAEKKARNEERKRQEPRRPHQRENERAGEQIHEYIQSGRRGETDLAGSHGGTLA